MAGHCLARSKTDSARVAKGLQRTDADPPDRNAPIARNKEHVGQRQSLGRAAIVQRGFGHGQLVCLRRCFHASASLHTLATTVRAKVGIRAPRVNLWLKDQLIRSNIPPAKTATHWRGFSGFWMRRKV